MIISSKSEKACSVQFITRPDSDGHNPTSNNSQSKTGQGQQQESAHIRESDSSAAQNQERTFAQRVCDILDGTAAGRGTAEQAMPGSARGSQQAVRDHVSPMLQAAGMLLLAGPPVMQQGGSQPGLYLAAPTIMRQAGTAPEFGNPSPPILQHLSSSRPQAAVVMHAVCSAPTADRHSGQQSAAGEAPAQEEMAALSLVQSLSCLPEQQQALHDSAGPSVSQPDTALGAAVLHEEDIVGRTDVHGSSAAAAEGETAQASLNASGAAESGSLPQDQPHVQQQTPSDAAPSAEPADTTTSAVLLCHTSTGVDSSAVREATYTEAAQEPAAAAQDMPADPSVNLPEFVTFR